jgi:hypothetical protein
MAEQYSVLIVGETPEKVDFSDPAVPRGTTPETIRAGLEASLNELRSAGRCADLVLLDDKDSAPEQMAEALGWASYDVIVIGAGLRIIPNQTEMFEMVMNIIHEAAPHARLAFNMKPDDSGAAAERQLSRNA